MGKWDYLNGEMTSRHNEIIEEVRKLDDLHLMREWQDMGSPSLEDYGLTFYDTSRRQNCCVIDNTEDKNLNKVPFMMFTRHQDYHATRILPTECSERLEKQALVAAHRTGVQRACRVVKYQERNDDRTMAVPGIINLAPGVVVLAPPDESNSVNSWSDVVSIPSPSSLSVYPNFSDGRIVTSDIAPQVLPVKELSLGKILEALQVAGMTAHNSRGEYILVGNEEELKKFAVTIQQQAIKFGL